ncbi:hypothetical protein Zmor_001368 [Zophobas morio]|uniref:Uncharacterized protein n=1 Tax=Zophobas morio TaxID=2755281 RepID=A0AA38MSA7_9CUCU|nr:hypothetical protein Zmor_001368 [Zophobas morio]
MAVIKQLRMKETSLKRNCVIPLLPTSHDDQICQAVDPVRRADLNSIIATNEADITNWLFLPMYARTITKPSPPASLYNSTTTSFGVIGL